MSNDSSLERIAVTQIVLFLAQFRCFLIRTIRDIVDHEMNWRPSAGIDSIGMLVRKVAGLEAYWIHEVVGPYEVGRIRTSRGEHSEFQASGLLEELERVGKGSMCVLECISDSDLAAPRTYWSNDEQRQKHTNVHWCLLNVIARMAMSFGQIQYVRKLYLDAFDSV